MKLVNNRDDTGLHASLSTLKYNAPTRPYHFSSLTENIQTFVSLFMQLIFYITYSSLDSHKVSGRLKSNFY